MEFKKTLRKFFKAKTSAELPQESVNGQVLYAEDENSLYIDTDSSRNRINPPADWEEDDTDSPSYVANKPELGSVAAKNVAEEIGENDDIPTSAQVNEAIQNVWADLEDMMFWVNTIATNKVYGVNYNYNNSSSVLTRTGEAVGFTNPVPATSITASGTSPFDDVYPWSDIKEVNILSDGTIIQKGNQDFSYNSDTMIWIPEFYYKVEKDDTTKIHSWNISDKKAKGFKKHPGSGRYVGKYHMNGSSSGVYSNTGVAPLVNTTKVKYREYAQKKGTNWHILDVATWSAIQILYLVEFANFNSQTVLGNGWNTGSAGTVGGTNNASYHTVKVSGAHNQYRYIEDPFSNVYDFVDGLMVYNRYMCISDDIGVYDDILKYTPTTIEPCSTGYILEIAYDSDADFAFIPGKTSSQEYPNNYITDKTWATGNDSDIIVGGDSTRTTHYGIFALNASANVGGALSFAGSRLIYIP